MTEPPPADDRAPALRARLAATGAGLPRRVRRWLPRVALLAVLPLVLLAPCLVGARWFLPQAPVMFDPLASEDPAAATRARETAHYWTGDRLLPILLDQREIAARVRAGQRLGWEPDLSLGLPLLGNALSGPFYPPNALALVLPPARAAAWLAFLSLVLAGVGMWRFLERRGLPAGAAAVGALGLQAAGFGVLNLHYGMKVDAILWLPFCLTAIEDVARGRRWAGAAVLVTAALPFTTGFPPIAAFALAAAALYALVFLGPLRRLFGIDREPAPHAMPRVLALLALAPLVAAPALLPTAEAAAESLRADKPAAVLRQESLPGVQALGLLAPHLWGRPSDPIPGNRQPAVWWFTPPDQWTKAEGASPLEWDPWTGAALLVLAVIGLLRGGARGRFPALLVLLAFGFAQGWPVIRWAYHLPGFDAGAPARALSIAWIGWAWLGALGATALLQRRGGSRRIGVGFALALCVVAMVVASAIQPRSFGEGMEKRLAARYGFPVEEVRQVIDPATTVVAARQLELSAMWAATLLGVAAGAILLGGLGSRRRLPLALGAAFLVEAIIIGRDHTSGLDLPPGRELFPPSATLDAVRAASGGHRVWRIDRSAALDETMRLARPNLLTEYGARDLSAYVAFTPRRTVELFEALHSGTRFRSGVASLPTPELLDHPILDRADVGAVLAVEPLTHERLELAHAAPGFAVHRRTGALGPARVARRAEVVEEPIARLARLLDRGTDPRDVVLIEREPPEGVAQPDAPELFEPGELTVTRPTPGRIDVVVRGGSGGWLVVHEAYAPGWTATVDGEPVTPFAADHAFLAVPLPRGGASVAFEFRSPTSRGAWIGLVALVLGLALSPGRRSLA